MRLTDGARQPTSAAHWMQQVLNQVQHRPWPLPAGPWVMAQSWHDLLFAHWRIDAALLRRQIPAVLSIDTFDGSAWIAVVPFRMSGVRPRLAPAVPGLSAFPELNVRTYVTAEGKPGVWFFSLDAASVIAVAAARATFHLPYFRARMSCTTQGDEVTYSSVRMDPPTPAAELSAKYGPIGPVELASRGSLEHWLSEI